MNVLFRIIALLIVAIIPYLILYFFSQNYVPSLTSPFEQKEYNWNIRSIDTMKTSRDLAREKMNDAAFDELIDTQVRLIAETGATHVAIGTPYDPEFNPYLRRWVSSARKYNLKVWYRGNFSGWEGWFGYPIISKTGRAEKLVRFIEDNKLVFENGDIFSSCTECENGALGDPRDTKDIEGYRSFLIDEYDLVRKNFIGIEKNVEVRMSPMNGDVAKLIMDKKTTNALGGIVAIDHYVKTPEMLNEYVNQIAVQSGGNVMISEFGAPIPDINGVMTEEEQSLWVENALMLLSKNPNVVGVNYWTNMASSTALWNEDTTPRLVVPVIKKYYSKIN